MQQLITFSSFLNRQLSNRPDAEAIIEILTDIEQAIKEISAIVAKGALSECSGCADSKNSQGEKQTKLDIFANHVILDQCGANKHLFGMVSEEIEQPYKLADEHPEGNYILFFDPLDGSSNIDVNVSVGTIFSLFKYSKKTTHGKLLANHDFLLRGCDQIAAGYAIYGPSTMLILTVGNGTHGFTLGPETDEFISTHLNLVIPEDTSEFAINASNERFWEPAVNQYINECKQGSTGPRGRDFNMRWIASMVAEIHRILMRGGIFMYPADSRTPGIKGRLRLMYEANPMAMLIENAGGAASTGYESILKIKPDDVHERVPVILGSKNEVERITNYHNNSYVSDDMRYQSPLFSERGLFGGK